MLFVTLFSMLMLHGSADFQQQQLAALSYCLPDISDYVL